MRKYELGSTEVDPIELKWLLLKYGVSVPREKLVEEFSDEYRVSNAGMKGFHLIKPNEEFFGYPDILQMPDGMLSAMIAPRNGSPFSITVESKRAYLNHNEEKITEVGFLPHLDFYQQRTSDGVPFHAFGRLVSGEEIILNPSNVCEYAKTGNQCKFCVRNYPENSGDIHSMNELPKVTVGRIGEMLDWVFNKSKMCDHLALIGGSMIKNEGLFQAEFLKKILDAGNISHIPGEIDIFSAPPRDLKSIDTMFEISERYGTTKLGMDIEIWDPKLFAEVCPGKAKFVGRDNWIKALEYTAKNYGESNACASFVVGIEPIESLLEGCQYLGSRGIVPLFSIWQPYDRPIAGVSEIPGLDYIKKLAFVSADINERYGLKMPMGPMGCGFCTHIDFVRYQDDILKSDKYLELGGELTC